MGVSWNRKWLELIVWDSLVCAKMPELFYLFLIDASNVVVYAINMNQFFYDSQTSLGYLTITTNRLMSAYFRKRLIEAGIELTAEQWGVLAHLWNEGGVAQDELAALVCVNKSSLSRVLDGMERRGLVIRQKDPADARRNILSASESSLALQEPCMRLAEEVADEIVRTCDPKEVAVCLKVLQQVKVALKDVSD